MMHEQETEGLVCVCVWRERGAMREWIKITSQKYLLLTVLITYAFMC